MENLSIVIPVKNEEENIPKLVNEIEMAFKNVPFHWEVLWVNDSSTDETQKVLENFSSLNPNHKLINHPISLGQSAAVLSGIRFSRYPLIATLDGDGQNSPNDLLALKRLLEDTSIYLAQGVRIERQDNGLRLFSTGLANIVRNLFLSSDFHDVGCAVRVFRKDIILGFPSFKGWHRFLPVMVSFLYPDMVLEHPVSHRPRIAGVTKYGIRNRLWVGLFDLVGMIWFKYRLIKIPENGVQEWKKSFTPLDSQDSSFSHAGSLFNG